MFAIMIIRQTKLMEVSRILESSERILNLNFRLARESRNILGHPTMKIQLLLTCSWFPLLFGAMNNVSHFEHFGMDVKRLYPSVDNFHCFPTSKKGPKAHELNNKWCSKVWTISPMYTATLKDNTETSCFVPGVRRCLTDTYRNSENKKFSCAISDGSGNLLEGYWPPTPLNVSDTVLRAVLNSPRRWDRSIRCSMPCMSCYLQ